MNISIQKPIVREVVFASYIEGNETRKDIFEKFQPLGYRYESEYASKNPDGEDIITIILAKQTTLENWLLTNKE